MDLREVLESFFESIPETYFVGLFEEGGLLVDSVSKIGDLDSEMAAGASQTIVQAIESVIDKRSREAYGPFKEAIIETENALISVAKLSGTGFGIVGIFEKDVPLGLVRNRFEKTVELLQTM